MDWNITFFLNSIFLGIGLAMDAFSVSLVNGLQEPSMSKRRTCFIAGVFGVFQAIMPMMGWICVHTIVSYFKGFKIAIPWIAVLLLLYIGGKMLLDGIRNRDDIESEKELKKTGFGILLLQGVATSIDALSTGFVISEYSWLMALVCSILIAVVTFFICVGGILIGKKFGTKLSHKATILGGIILILIGIEIFIKG